MKITLALLLTISIALNIYLLNLKDSAKQVVFDNKTESKLDQVKTKSAGLQKLPEKKPTITLKEETEESRSEEIISNPTLYTGLPTEEELVEAQERWREDISDFFVEDLELRERDVDQYFAIKDARDKELSKFLTERIKSQGSFIYTLEDMVDENKINERYLKELKALMGKRGYENYKAFRDKHNREMIQNNKTHSLIEL